MREAPVSWPTAFRQAAEAFADAECHKMLLSGGPAVGHAMPDHAACRAALLKEIGL